MSKFRTNSAKDYFERQILNQETQAFFAFLQQLKTKTLFIFRILAPLSCTNKLSLTWATTTDEEFGEGGGDGDPQKLERS